MIEHKPDIIEIIQSEGIELRKRGKYYKALCSLHSERTPSFKVDTDKQIFYCFGCNEKGDVISFIQKYKNYSFKDALIYLGINNNDKKIINPNPKEVKKKILVKEYQQWEKIYLIFLSDILRNLEQKKLNAKTIEEVEEMSVLYHKEPIWEYHWDILFNGKEKEKIKLYGELKYGEKKVDIGNELLEMELEYNNKVTDVTVDNQNKNFDKDIISPCSFPLDILPDELINLINKLYISFQVPHDVIAACMLTIISGAIGNSIKTYVKKEWEVSPFLWTMIIAPSGYGKSPIINALMKYVKNKQAESYKDFKNKLQDYELQLLKYKKEGNFENPAPQKPNLSHSFVSDFTLESLSNVFENDPRGIVIYSDEISKFIKGLNQYKATGNDRQHILELFDCNSWKIDRKGKVKFIPNTGASIIGGIQTKILPSIFSDDSFDDGLILRFLLLPGEDITKKFSKDSLQDSEFEYWNSLLDYCYQIPLNFDEKGFVKPNLINLDNDALNEFGKFHDSYHLNKQYLSENASIFIPKLITYSLKFAGILQVLNSFDKRMIETLYKLKDTVKDGYILLSEIRNSFNNDLPENSRLTSEKISSILRELNLTTEKRAYNLSYLLWEQEDIQAIAHEIVSLLKPHIENNKSDIQDILFDIDGLSKYLNVKKQWVYDKVHQDAIPYYKVGKYPRFKKIKIDEWLQKREKGNSKKQTNTVRKLLE